MQKCSSGMWCDGDDLVKHWKYDTGYKYHNLPTHSSVHHLHTEKRLNPTHLICYCKVTSLLQNKMKLNNAITQ